MSSQSEIVRKLGTLAKLALSDDEVERFGDQTGRIIGYFQSLKALDLSGVEPTAHVIDIECWRRPDETGETLKCLPDLFPYLKMRLLPGPASHRRGRGQAPTRADRVCG